MKRIIFIVSFLQVFIAAQVVMAQRIISLDGSWDFRMGDNPHKYNDYVMLPGSMLTNDKGNPVSTKTQWTGSLYDSSYYFNPYMEKYRQEQGVMKFPFFLTPERHYVGAAWYRRKIYVPEDWKEQHITLFLERPHIETTVFVNGQEVGHDMSLSTPHRFDVTKYIKVGEQNEIAIRVYNGIENVCVGQDSHSVTDQTQGNWNGIVGRIELQAQWKKLYIKKVSINTDTISLKVGERYKKEAVMRVEVDLDNHLNRIMPMWDYEVTVSVSPMVNGKSVPARLRSSSLLAKGKDKLKFEFFLNDDLKPWDEFHPNLYNLTVEAGEDIYVTTFGLRSIEAEGRQLRINGHPLFLRGTVENCCFPETGYPPTDVESWTKIFMKCKEYGLNHVRFHSYCPPDAAFTAADIVGIYLQVEGPSWPNHGVKLRRGQAIDKYLLEESKRIVDEYGHHPSFIMMAAGNEPAGDWVSYCNDWVYEMSHYDRYRLYCGASVGGGWAWDDGSEYHVKGGARGLDWDRHAPSSDDDYYDGIEFPRNYKPEIDEETGKPVPNQSPVIAHEQGQWCAFPDLSETSQYTGVYKARNFEIFSDLLRDNGMASQASKFLMASGHLQTLCYKYEIERNLRTKDYAGFQLLGINDYSGQGTALVGPLNVHWREKDYVQPVQWREFCNAIVPLARFPRFVYTNGDTLRVPVEIYSSVYANIKGTNITYNVINDSASLVTNGVLSPNMLLPIGKNTQAGTVELPLTGFSKPCKLTLAVQLSGTFQNSWDFWVYPDSVELNARNIYISDDFDAKAREVLAQGGDVLLTAAGKVTLGNDVKQSYLPVFWNTSWFKMRPPHTTGAYIDKDHPLFKYDFPTDDWSNLNWWELLNKAQVMNLMELPADYQPPIQPIDTWHVSRKLGMVVEAKVGKGRLFMTTMDISTDLDHRVVARQMRHAILSYMQSEDFQPKLSLQPDIIEHFFTRQAPPVNLFTKDSPDELKPKIN